MKPFIFLFLAAISSKTIYSQVDILVKVKQTHSKQAKLYFYDKADLIPIDSSSPQSPETFKFSLKDGYKQGTYKFALGKNISFDFIVADEPKISLETVVFAAEDSLKSIISKENEVYIKYLQVKKKYKQQLWHLNSLIDYYNENSSFNQSLSNETIKVNKDFYNDSKQIAIENPNLFVSNLILLELKPRQIIELSKKDKQVMKDNWWNEVNFCDKRLASSSTLDQKLWEFIVLFFDDNLDKEQQDSAFISASKIVMNLNADTSILSGFRYFIFKNFLDTDYDATTKFLFKTSFTGLQPMKLSLEEQSAYRAISNITAGSKAYDIKSTTSDGKNFKLSKIDSPYKLVVFWSMYCLHCTELMPELLKTYNQFKAKGLEIIAISIDDSDVDWHKYIAEKKFNWINALEPENRAIKIFKEYNIDGTPLLFLVDSKLSIVSRPSTIKQLEAKLKQVLK